MANGKGLVLVGCGLAGKRHLATIEQYNDSHADPYARAELTAIVDPDEATKTLCRKYNADWFPTLQDCFSAGAKPDGIILATPNDTHVELGILSIEQGVPLLIEKPIATSVQDAQRLVEQAERADVAILVGHHRRHHPLIRTAKNIIDDNRLGKIRAVHGSCWLYKPDDYFDDADWRKKKGAGPVFVNLIHDIDLIAYLCGAVVSVYAEGTASLRGYENEDVASAILRLKNDALCTLAGSDMIASPWSWELTAGENAIYPRTQENCYLIGGTEASLSIPGLSLWRHEPTQSWWNPIKENCLASEQSDPFVNQIAHFMRVIAKEVAPLVSGRDAIESLRVIEAIQSSIEEQRIIRL